VYFSINIAAGVRLV